MKRSSTLCKFSVVRLQWSLLTSTKHRSCWIMQTSSKLCYYFCPCESSACILNVCSCVGHTEIVFVSVWCEYDLNLELWVCCYECEMNSIGRWHGTSLLSICVENYVTNATSVFWKNMGWDLNCDTNGVLQITPISFWIKLYRNAVEICVCQCVDEEVLIEPNMPPIHPVLLWSLCTFWQFFYCITTVIE